MKHDAPAPPPTGVAVVQFKPVKGDVAANVATLQAIFAQLHAAGAPHIIVLPEACLTGYFLEGAVYELAFNTDHISDLEPLRALPQLRRLFCAGQWPCKGQVRDLAPLRSLRHLYLLECNHNPVEDLAPFSARDFSRAIAGLDSPSP